MFILLEIMSVSRAPKTNQSQWAVLVDFLIDNPEMVTKAFVGLDSRQRYKRLWEEVAIQLNSMGYGTKTAEKWIDVSWYFIVFIGIV